MVENYNDIINLPQHVSATHRAMSLHDRAAQFSPFAALTGYDAQIAETGRLTDEKAELDEDRQAKIDACLQILLDNAAERPEISVMYYLPDEKKSGGKYITVNGAFRRIDESIGTVVLTDGTNIRIADIADFSGAIFYEIGGNEDYYG